MTLILLVCSGAKCFAKICCYYTVCFCLCRYLFVTQVSPNRYTLYDEEFSKLFNFRLQKSPKMCTYIIYVLFEVHAMSKNYQSISQIIILLYINTCLKFVVQMPCCMDQLANLTLSYSFVLMLIKFGSRKAWPDLSNSSNNFKQPTATDVFSYIITMLSLLFNSTSRRNSVT